MPPSVRMTSLGLVRPGGRGHGRRRRPRSGIRARSTSWRGPGVSGEFPTLGYAVAELIQDKCVIPDGEHAGEAFLLTDEMLRFLLHFYRLDPESCRFAHDRGGQLVRPQKWGKGPFSASV